MYIDYAITEIKTTVLLMVNLYKHLLFTRLMSPLKKSVISFMVVVIENLVGIIITKICFAIDTANGIQNFQNISGTATQKHQLHPKMEYSTICLYIQIWIKKM